MADLDTLRAIVEARRRCLFAAEADLYEAEGDRDSAAWKRAEADGRTKDADRAWAVMMARRFLERGTEPAADDWRRDDILAAMSELRWKTGALDEVNGRLA